MVWKVCLGVCIAFLVGIIGFGAFLVFSKKRIKFPIAVFILFEFLGGAALYFPIYWGGFHDPIRSILVSFHSALQLFTIDAGFDTMFDAGEELESISVAFKETYYYVAAVYYIFAPVLTAGFIMSFLSSFHNFFKFKISFAKEVYVFNEMNKKTVNLAKSIKAQKKRATIVFCDITNQIKEESDELYEELLDIRAICLGADITTLNFNHHSKSSNKSVHFFLISDDDEKLINQYSALVKKHSNMENGKIYLFSRSAQSDLIFNSSSNKKIECRKYDSDFLIIYNYLYENGIELFNTAHPIDDKTKQINVVIVGFGLNGKMLTRALAWFCQMDGYRLEINVFDADPMARSKFAEQSPDLLNPAFAKPDAPEENQYVINIHSGISVGTEEFVKGIEELTPKATIAFTCLGDDELNHYTAMKLREIFERKGNGNHPPIVSVVYTSDKEYVLEATNHKGQKYDIQCIGSYEHTYTYDFVIDSALEKAAVGVHTRYGSSTMSLFGYAYNFRSSCASAIHLKTKVALKIHNSHLGRDKLSQEELEAIAAMEHRRWSAWTRSEGFVYGEQRNDLAKTHWHLIEYSKLSREVKDYDIKVGTLDEDAPEDEEE